MLLHFWTAGCVNCLHVLAELTGLQQRWGEALVVLGVHSPKFAHEGSHQAVVTATRRHRVHHPVLDDPQLRTWDAYNVKAWPTLVLVDPGGYVARTVTGEGHALEGAELDVALAAMTGPAGAEPPPAAAEPGVPEPGAPGPASVGFPAGLLATGSGRAASLLVADPGAGTVSQDGRVRWRAAEAGWVQPAGMTRLPDALAAEVGYHVVLADAAGHRLHGLNLDDGTARPVAGTGLQWRHGDDTQGPASSTALSTPSDVAWWPERGAVVVALAGNHTLAVFDPRRGVVHRLAGTGVEGLTDGPAAEAFLAQPTAVAAAGSRLWFVDAEASALRWLDADGVHTALGAGLFDYGHLDGAADVARLQHPQGVAALADGTVLVADTYNGAVRRHDPRSGDTSTLARGLTEPQAVAVHQGRLLVAAGHGVHDLGRVEPATTLAPGPVRLDVSLAVPPGCRPDDRDAPPARLSVRADPPHALVQGSGTGAELSRELHLAGAGAVVLHVHAQLATCEVGVAHPACRVVHERWLLPVQGGPGGVCTLRLGTDGRAG